MTALAFCSGPSYVALATDSFMGGEGGRPLAGPPKVDMRKFHTFPGNRLAVLGGVAGAARWPESVVSVMDRLARDSDLPATVDGLARRIEVELLRAFGRLWRPNSGDGVMGFLAGIEAGTAVVVFLAVSVGGVLAHREHRGVGGGVLPVSGMGTMTAPRDIEHARQLAAALIQQRIDAHAADPVGTQRRPAVAPIHTLTLEPVGVAA